MLELESNQKQYIIERAARLLNEPVASVVEQLNKAEQYRPLSYFEYTAYPWRDIVSEDEAASFEYQFECRDYSFQQIDAWEDQASCFRLWCHRMGVTPSRAAYRVYKTDSNGKRICAKLIERGVWDD